MYFVENWFAQSRGVKRAEINWTGFFGSSQGSELDASIVFGLKLVVEAVVSIDDAELNVFKFDSEIWIICDAGGVFSVQNNLSKRIGSYASFIYKISGASEVLVLLIDWWINWQLIEEDVLCRSYSNKQDKDAKVFSHLVYKEELNIKLEGKWEFIRTVFVI